MEGRDYGFPRFLPCNSHWPARTPSARVFFIMGSSAPYSAQRGVGLGWDFLPARDSAQCHFSSGIMKPRLTFREWSHDDLCTAVVAVDANTATPPPVTRSSSKASSGRVDFVRAASPVEAPAPPRLAASHARYAFVYGRAVWLCRWAGIRSIGRAQWQGHCRKLPKG